MLTALLVLQLASTAGPADPTGFTLSDAGCATGGFDYHFFPGGVVISTCEECEERPRVQEGTWRADRADVVVEMRREWVGVGQGEPIRTGGVDGYQSYVAAVRPVGDGSASLRLRPEDFAQEGGCATTRRHDRPPDPRAFLRAFAGQHPETSHRALEEGELRGRTPAELRAMRGEILARYGFRFADATLTADFARQPGYDPHLVDVDAFLSDVERRNVERLEAAERTAGARSAR